MSGVQLEKKFSQIFHAKGIPLLVSPLLLRSRDLGQMDLARLVKSEDWIIEFGEVKSSIVGVEQMERFQKSRLFSTQLFLGSLFGYPVKLLRFIGKTAFIESK